ncbi:MAG TPA: iron-sulfur cluster assembly protein, partial [Candidatus Paceibacterota bacterium]|nr:iron-sulfur cluster assembly protein [Candidatus Paceibacterota bacterium]
METAILKRDCEAVLIPYGEKILLPAGDEVEISQTLGGSFTVYSRGRLARIEGRDADALGKEIPAPTVPLPPATPGADVDEKLVWDQLRTCYDPEIPVNIVDLGLVYDLQIFALP